VSSKYNYQNPNFLSVTSGVRSGITLINWTALDSHSTEMGQTVECLLSTEEEIEGQNGFQLTGNENQPRESGH
jgi:hypothetical protein